MISVYCKEKGMKIEDVIKSFADEWCPGIVPTDELGYWNINVQFINAEGVEDETQFDIKPYKFDYGTGKCKELVDLWKEFCKENSFKQNSVMGISFGTCN